MNAGSGTSGILYVRPTFEKFPVSADITDATSDGQSNPGKVLKTDANGALQIEELTLGNSSVGTAGGVRIVGTTNTATIFNDDDSTAALKFGSTSGAILSTGDASATFSSGKAILWGTSADATLTNLGGGTAGKAIFGAATKATAATEAGLGTTDSVTFANVTVSASGNTAQIAPLPSFNSGNTMAVTGSAGYGYMVTYGSHNTNLIAAVGQYPRNDGILLGSANSITWSTTTTITGTVGTRLSRSANGILSIDTIANGNGLGSLNLTNLTASGTVTAADLVLTEKSADPSDPAEGKSVIWQSDGTGAGDDGDIMIKITAGGVTKTTTLVDFSTI
jgi:hypothetical protein